jgi:hypothetical protein
MENNPKNIHEIKYPKNESLGSSWESKPESFVTGSKVE